MNLETTQRLAHIRSQMMMWSAQTDTSGWDVSFLLELLAQKDREIHQLRLQYR